MVLSEEIYKLDRIAEIKRLNRNISRLEDLRGKLIRNGRWDKAGILLKFIELRLDRIADLEHQLKIRF